MPLFRFRLEAQDDSGHFRTGTTEAESEDAARVQLMLREYTWAAYQLDPERQQILLDTYGVESLEELPEVHHVDATEEEKATFRSLETNHRAWLNLHRQKEPYSLVSLEEVDG